MISVKTSQVKIAYKKLLPINKYLS